jgi:hypothetical protein
MRRLATWQPALDSKDPGEELYEPRLRPATVMKADTFAKLVVLQTLVDSEVGYLLEHRPASVDQFREGLITRVSDLVDEIDALDAVAAARTYDAIVDFLAQLPEEDEGVVESTLKFQRALARTVERGMDQSERKQASTWAMVLHELLEELRTEYEAALDGETVNPRGISRATALLGRARDAAERIADDAGGEGAADLRDDVARLGFAIEHRHMPPRDVDPLITASQRRAARYRPSPLSRIGAFVLGQVLTRDRRRRQGEPPGGIERRRRDTV